MIAVLNRMGEYCGGVMLTNIVVLSAALMMPAHGGRAARTMQYSDMRLNPESGDLHGYDLQIVRVGDRREVTMFCGEGGLVGPVHGVIPEGSASVTIAKSEDGCAGTMKLTVIAGAIRIELEDGSTTVVPRHKNYMQAKEWK